MHIAPAGDRALLVTLPDVTADELHARAAAIRATPDVLACIPGHSSLLVVFAGAPNVAIVRGSFVAGARVTPHTTHTIPVAFDGEDLPEFLARIRLTRDDFLARVDGRRLTARYLGFRGGFAYLDGWPGAWAMPRRPTSRPVRRGAFAIAGDVAGFYPIDTPGGWNLLGTTPEDVEERFRAGDAIEIRVVESVVLVHAAARTAEPRRFPDFDIAFGPLVTAIAPVDWSRVERGIAEGGAFDDEAAGLVARAVTNPIVFECPMIAPRIRYHAKKTVAWFDGALRVEEVEGEHTFGKVQQGLRGYLAIGDERSQQSIDEPVRGDRHVIQAIAGPHDVGIRELECDVTPKLDRVGIRMIPRQPIDVAIPADLKSCGMLCGTMQLHPDGSVVVMGPDHPVTGGYLMPMTVLAGERWKLAQLAPGERVRFVAVQPPNW